MESGRPQNSLAVAAHVATSATAILDRAGDPVQRRMQVLIDDSGFRCPKWRPNPFGVHFDFGPHVGQREPK